MANIQYVLRKIHKKPLLWAAAFVVALVLILCVGLFERALYFYNNPLIDPTHGFQYLQPTKLPDKLTMTGKRIVVEGDWRSSESHDSILNFVLGFFMPIIPNDVAAEINFRTEEDWSYNILERRHTDEPITITLHNYDPTSEGATCTERVTSENKSYRLCHWIEYGTIGVYEVEYIQDGTFIDARLPTQPIKSLSEGELDTFVDSFTPSKADGIPVIYSAGG